jgi:hypothetical protein
MTIKNDNAEPISPPKADRYPTDPRNPGSAGMPGANPGFSDPGQRQTGGNREESREAEDTNSLTTEGTGEEKREALTKKQDQAALDRWSLDGGSS